MLFRARVLRHKSDFLTVDRPEPVLRDGRAARIAASIAEELLLTPKPRDVDVPPPFVLRGEQLPHRAARQVRVKDADPRSLPQQRDDGEAPHRHERLSVQRGVGAPSGPILGEATLGNQDVQVAVEIQVTAEGVRDHGNHQPDAVGLPCPLLQHLRAQDGQIIAGDAGSAGTTARAHPGMVRQT